MRDLKRAIDCGYVINTLFYCPEQDQSPNHSLQNIDVDTVYQVSPAILEKTSYRSTPSPIVAILNQKPLPNVDELNSDEAPLILGLVDLRKPGNIGALLRTADATGFKHIFLIDTSLDLYNPNIIRSSTGASFLNNIYSVTTDQALTFFNQHNYSMISALVDGDTLLPDATFAPPSAVILGTEDVGLNETWENRCDIRVRIPMVGEVTDSFNVSVSGAMFMYEALRQSRW